MRRIGKMVSCWMGRGWIREKDIRDKKDGKDQKKKQGSFPILLSAPYLQRVGGTQYFPLASSHSSLILIDFSAAGAGIG